MWDKSVGECCLWIVWSSNECFAEIPTSEKPKEKNDADKMTRKWSGTIWLPVMKLFGIPSVLIKSFYTDGI